MSDPQSAVRNPPSPAALGYRVPAEWAPHAATWLSWPHRQKTWPGHFEPIPQVWAQLVRTLAASEPVHILAGGEAVMAQARALVGDVPGVTLHDIPTNDAWARDHGPMFLVGPSAAPQALVDWGFNAWGGKYHPWDADDAVGRRVAAVLGCRRFEPGIILEGGAVDFNGAGSVLTSEQCLLNPNRNPHLTRRQLEQVLADYCAAHNVIWLGEGIAGDDTDGHVDELARFVGPRTVAAAVEDDPADVNFAPLRDNFDRLLAARDEQGRPLEVVPLKMPRPFFCDGKRLPGSYTNFYIANTVVVVPQFDDPADRAALETLARCFPDRRVVGQRAVELALGRGAFHCITQQQPAAA